ncbi:hypothetical protein D3C85_914120 [compost metagenome]
MQFAALGVHLWVRGASRGHPVAEALVPFGSQRVGVELKGLMRLFEGEQPVAMPQHAGVGRATVLALRQRVAGGGVAESAEERAPGFMFELPFRRARPTVAVRHAALVDVEGMHHAVAGEPVVVVVARRVLRAWADTVQATRQSEWHRAFDVEVRDVVLLGERCVVAGEEVRVRLCFCVHVEPLGFICEVDVSFRRAMACPT